jgi:hypothetical protein
VDFKLKGVAQSFQRLHFPFHEFIDAHTIFLSLVRLVFPLRTDIHGGRYAPIALHCFSSEKPKAYGVLREFLRAAIAK